MFRFNLGLIASIFCLSCGSNGDKDDDKLGNNRGNDEQIVGLKGCETGVIHQDKCMEKAVYTLNNNEISLRIYDNGSLISEYKMFEDVTDEMLKDFECNDEKLWISCGSSEYDATPKKNGFSTIGIKYDHIERKIKWISLAYDENRKSSGIEFKYMDQKFKGKINLEDINIMEDRFIGTLADKSYEIYDDTVILSRVVYDQETKTIQGILSTK